MSKQFRLDEGFGKGCAIHGNQGPCPSRAEPVQALGNQLLAGAALTDDQYRAVQRSGTACSLDRIQKGE
jgi:hypothetical protein